jgi:hypothetical protein
VLHKRWAKNIGSAKIFDEAAWDMPWPVADELEYK